MKRLVKTSLLAFFILFWVKSTSAQSKYSFSFYIEQEGFKISQSEDGLRVVLRYLESFPQKTKISDPMQDLILQNVTVDEYGMTHLTLIQMHKGVEVRTGSVKVHFDRLGTLSDLNGTYYHDVDLDPSPTIDSSHAESAALEDAKKGGEARIVKNDRVRTKLIIYPLHFINPADSGKYILAWTVHIAGETSGGSWEYLIDAKDGEVVYRFSQLEDLSEVESSKENQIRGVPDTANSLPTKKSPVEAPTEKKEEPAKKFDPSDPSTYPPNLKIIPIPLDSLEKLKGKNKPDSKSMHSAGSKVAGELGWINVVTENFEGDIPTGDWAVFDLEAANGYYYWDEDDFKPRAGINSAWCANGPTELDPTYNVYPEQMDAYMMFGPFDLIDATVEPAILSPPGSSC